MGYFEHTKDGREILSNDESETSGKGGQSVSKLSLSRIDGPRCGRCRLVAIGTPHGRGHITGYVKHVCSFYVDIAGDNP